MEKEQRKIPTCADNQPDKFNKITKNKLSMPKEEREIKKGT